jgi:hypothetical protein
VTKPLAEVTAFVAAPGDAVLERVARRVGWEFDRDRRVVWFQGGWWYRGEYTVEDVPGGTRLTHRVVNVATRARWGVPLANRFFVGFRAKVEAGFAELVKEVV